MNNILLQKHKSVQDFYEIRIVKKHLESEDPVKGAFELAYFDTQRTLRGIGQNENRKTIKQGIYDIISKWYLSLAEHFENYSLRDYDGSFMICCREIIAVGEKYQFTIHFGQAQKLINMFFKYMLLVDERLNLHLDYFHVPFDGIILNGIAKNKGYDLEMRSYAKKCMPWSKMEDVTTYMSLQDELRELYEYPIIFEFEAWNKWKK